MLRYREDRRSLAFIGAFFALVAAGYALIEAPWYVQLPLVIATAQLSFFCAVITHNTVHVPMFRRRSLNKLTQVVLTVTYGHPVSAFVPGHNLSHHLHTQTPRDLMRTSKARFRWNLLNQLCFTYLVTGAVTKSNFEYAAKMRTQRPAWFRQFLLEWAVFVVFCGALLWLDWRAFLLYVMLPHQFAAWGIVGVNFIQHDGCDPKHPYNHSRNFTGRLTNWWTFNNGFHGIHHMQPGLHWSRCPAAHAERLAPHIHPNLEQPSLLRYAWRAFVWPGKRLTYDGKPLQLPPETADQSWIPGSFEPTLNEHLGAA